MTPNPPTITMRNGWAHFEFPDYGIKKFARPSEAALSVGPKDVAELWAFKKALREAECDICFAQHGEDWRKHDPKGAWVDGWLKSLQEIIRSQ